LVCTIGKASQYPQWPWSMQGFVRGGMGKVLQDLLELANPVFASAGRVSVGGTQIPVA